jgi:hypothetical protein
VGRRQPACHKDAAELLRSFNLKPRRIAGVYPDAILWVDQDKQPKTTFIKVHTDEKGNITGREHKTVDDFPALGEVA